MSTTASDPEPKFIFFDTETTGCEGTGSILNEFHRIVQISAVTNDGQSFDSVVNPGCHIPKASTVIHGIDNKTAQASKRFGTIFAAFRKFVKQSTKRGTPIVLVAHNCFGFDKIMLEKECSRVGARIPTTWLFYDSLLAYRSHFVEMESKRLSDIYELRFGKKMENAHNSLADSIGLRDIFNNDLCNLFCMEDCVPTHGLHYLPNDVSVMKIRGIGGKSCRKLQRYFQKEHVFVGDLRFHMSTHTPAEIEIFIRNVIGTFKEAFVFSIFCEIMMTVTPHAAFKQFPFISHSFPSNIPLNTVDTLCSNFHVRSPEQLKRFYMFGLKEDGDRWERLVDELRVNRFHLAMAMRSVN